MANFNEHYFDVIDTEQKAYWLGFIAADGNIRTKPSSVIRINLARKDIDHLRKFANAVELNRPVREYTANGYLCCSVALGSNIMGTRLVELGIIPAKSHTIIPKPPLGFEDAYWRGVFDGDGSISINDRKRFVASVSFNGNIYMVNGFADWLNSKGIFGGYLAPHYKIFKFKTAGTNKPASILRALYENSSIYLDRKKMLSDTILGVVGRPKTD